MTKYAEEQLRKCKNVQFPETIEQEFVVTKKSVNNIKAELEVGGTYKIQLEEYIVHPFENFDLHENWNQGIVPTEYIYNAKVTQFMGKMVRVECKSDTGGRWTGWLPRKGFKVLD